MAANLAESSRYIRTRIASPIGNPFATSAIVQHARVLQFAGGPGESFATNAEHAGDSFLAFGPLV